MEEFIIVRYLHFLGIILLTSTLVLENFLFSNNLKNNIIKKLLLIDGLYGLSAILTFITGFILWFYVGKPSEFYTTNPIFHIKLTLFMVVVVLSIFPTVFLFRNRKSTSEVIVPKYIRLIKRHELMFLIMIPLVAVLMAYGITI
tara:strand:- start:203 stop:634 length:432 start_codon:yes stop_codon:yes gene_type:complete